MTIPKRFSLASLLLMTLAVAALLASWQWRRLHLVQEVNALNAVGSVTFDLPPVLRMSSDGRPLALGPITMTSWRTIEPSIRVRDGLWPTIETRRVAFLIQKTSAGHYVIANKEFSADDAREYLQEIQSRLENLGIRLQGIGTVELKDLSWRTSYTVDFIR